MPRGNFAVATCLDTTPEVSVDDGCTVLINTLIFGCVFFIIYSALPTRFFCKKFAIRRPALNGGFCRRRMHSLTRLAIATIAIFDKHTHFWVCFFIFTLKKCPTIYAQTILSLKQLSYAHHFAIFVIKHQLFKKIFTFFKKYPCVRCCL